MILNKKEWPIRNPLAYDYKLSKQWAKIGHHFIMLVPKVSLQDI